MGGAAPRGSVAHRQTLAVRYRAAREDELDVALDLFLDTLADMLRRNGIDPGELHREEWRSAYHHVFRTGLFRVAELDGRMAAICHAIVRGPLWFLSGYWTRPGLQGQGVGGPLLAAVWEEGRARGATTFSTWSSIDLTAMAAYLKRGMLPGYQILSFAGAVGEAAPPARYEAAPLSLELAAEVDRAVLSVAREVDHRFWLAKTGRVGRALMRDGRRAGYYYVRDAAIGPAAWLDLDAADAVLRLALRDARTQSPLVRLRALGANHVSIRFALGAGLRLAGYSHLLTTAPFGTLERYVPSGPTLF